MIGRPPAPKECPECGSDIIGEHESAWWCETCGHRDPPRDMTPCDYCDKVHSGSAPDGKGGVRLFCMGHIKEGAAEFFKACLGIKS